MKNDFTIAAGCFVVGIVTGLMLMVALLMTSERHAAMPKVMKQVTVVQGVTQTGDSLVEAVPTQETPQAVGIDYAAWAVPSVDVDMAEVIDILTDYSVVHEGKLLTYLKYYGLTDPRAKTIYINSDVAQSDSRDTVIHELLHVIYFRRGFDTSGQYEDLISQRAHEIYLKLYGPAGHGTVKWLQ